MPRTLNEIHQRNPECSRTAAMQHTWEQSRIMKFVFKILLSYPSDGKKDQNAIA